MDGHEVFMLKIGKFFEDLGFSHIAGEYPARVFQYPQPLDSGDTRRDNGEKRWLTLSKVTVPEGE